MYSSYSLFYWNVRSYPVKLFMETVFVHHFAPAVSCLVDFMLNERIYLHIANIWLTESIRFHNHYIHSPYGTVIVLRQLWSKRSCLGPIQCSPQITLVTWPNSQGGTNRSRHLFRRWRHSVQVYQTAKSYWRRLCVSARLNLLVDRRGRRCPAENERGIYLLRLPPPPSMALNRWLNVLTTIEEMKSARHT